MAVADQRMGAEAFRAPDTLDGAPPLSGFRLAVADIFAR